MQKMTRGLLPSAALLVAACAISGCSQTSSNLGSGLTSVKSMIMPSKSYAYNASDRERECLARAMFFESNRSSRDGLVAVGSVVMNRKETGKWGNNLCDVVGAPRQFAPGVLSRPMNSKALPDVMAAADSVLKGERHPKVGKDVMFFHTAGLKFPYKNMHYTTVAGGNQFYYKRDKKEDRLPIIDAPQNVVAPVMVADSTPSQPEALPGVAEAKPIQAPVTEVAFAGDAPTSGGKIRTTVINQKPAAPVDEPVVLADNAPIPSDPQPEPLVRMKKSKAKPADSVEVAFAEEAPIPESSPKTKIVKKAREAKAQQTVASAETRGSLGYDEPTEDRFGGAMPAYNDGNGTGVLGQLVVKAGSSY